MVKAFVGGIVTFVVALIGLMWLTGGQDNGFAIFVAIACGVIVFLSMCGIDIGAIDADFQASHSKDPEKRALYNQVKELNENNKKNNK